MSHPNCDVKTAAKLLCRCTKWVRAQIRKGNLTVFAAMSKNKFVIDGKSLDKFLDSRAVHYPNLSQSVDVKKDSNGTKKPVYTNFKFYRPVDK